MKDKTINYNALGQAIDTTWGRSSTPKTASYSVKINLQGDMLVVNYAAVVNFGSEREMIVMKRRYADESLDVINAVIKNVKKLYKALSDQTLSTSEMSKTDSLEIIGFGVHNPKRTAYYRRKVVFEIS